MCLKLYILMLGFAAGAALAQQTPAEIIDRLGPATRPDVSGNWDRQREAITAAAAELRSLTKTQPGHSTLTAVDALGRTPLMNAAVNGYAEIVDALLTDDAVRAGLETKDRFGASAWALGQFARPLTLFSCHPQMLVAERTALWRPYLQRSGYFLAGSSNSFERIAKSLLAAGARQDANAAKAAWKLECPGHDARIGQSVDATTDLLRALLLDTNERLERFNRTDPSLVPQLRTPPMLAWPDTSDVWEQSWPKPATAACSSKGVSQSIPGQMVRQGNVPRRHRIAGGRTYRGRYPAQGRPHRSPQPGGPAHCDCQDTRLLRVCR